MQIPHFATLLFSSFGYTRVESYDERRASHGAACRLSLLSVKAAVVTMIMSEWRALATKPGVKGFVACTPLAHSCGKSATVAGFCGAF